MEGKAGVGRWIVLIREEAAGVGGGGGWGGGVFFFFQAEDGIRFRDG